MYVNDVMKRRNDILTFRLKIENSIKNALKALKASKFWKLKVKSSKKFLLKHVWFSSH